MVHQIKPQMLCHDVLRRKTPSLRKIILLHSWRDQKITRNTWLRYRKYFFTFSQTSAHSAAPSEIRNDDTEIVLYFSSEPFYLILFDAIRQAVTENVNGSILINIFGLFCSWRQAGSLESYLAFIFHWTLKPSSNSCWNTLPWYGWPCFLSFLSLCPFYRISISSARTLIAC